MSGDVIGVFSFHPVSHSSRIRTHNAACKNVENQQAIREDGGIPAMVDLLQDKSSDVRLYALWALKNLSFVTLVAGRSFMWKLLISFVSLSFCVFVVLCSPAWRNALNQESAVEENAVQCILPLLSDTNGEVQREAAGAVWSIGTCRFFRYSLPRPLCPLLRFAACDAEMICAFSESFYVRCLP